MYWKNSDLISQVKEKAVPSFKILHSNCHGLFVLDNRQNYHAKTPDALSVPKMNMKDGGTKQRFMRNVCLMSAERMIKKQTMVLNDGKTFKGLQRVLSERGLWDPLLSVKDAREILSKHPDFSNQPEWLRKPLSKQGA